MQNCSMHKERVILVYFDVENINFFFHEFNGYDSQAAFLHRFPLPRVPRLWALSHSTNM